MNKMNVILENGERKEIYDIFYLYNSKYYFIYTQKEIDENGYVILYLCQIGKELQSTATGNVETGNMIAVDINNEEEWHKVQESISKIVEDKKNGTNCPEIQYLSNDLLKNLKIVSKKKFRLVRETLEQYFAVEFESDIQQNNESTENMITAPATPQVENILQPAKANLPLDIETSTENMITAPATPQTENVSQSTETNFSLDIDTPTSSENKVSTELEVPMPDDKDNLVINSVPNETVIVDYRAKLFEEQEKNKKLEEENLLLKNQLEEIKKIIG